MPVWCGSVASSPGRACREATVAKETFGKPPVLDSVDKMAPMTPATRPAADGLPVWEARAEAAVLAALAPGVPDDLHVGADVLVVGGGIVGLATAAACRRQGLGRV